MNTGHSLEISFSYKSTAGIEGQIEPAVGGLVGYCSFVLMILYVLCLVLYRENGV